MGKSPPDAPFKFRFDRYYSVWSERDDNWKLTKEQYPIFDDPKIEIFLSKIFSWSEENNLNETWCRSHAFETLDLWSLEERPQRLNIWQSLPRFFTAREVSNVLSYVMPNFDMKINFDLSEKLKDKLHFYPTYGIRSDFLEVIKELKNKVENLERNLLNFLDERESEAKKSLIKITQGEKQKKHFDWLVDFQVGKKSYSELTKEYYQEIENKKGKELLLSDKTKTIRKPINELKDILGLKLRSEGSSPGRPKRSK